MSDFVRYQSPVPNARGAYPGVFALVNGLAANGRLDDEQEAFRIENNAWFEANFKDPSTVDVSLYDRAVNPLATAWFRSSAADLIARVEGYLAILRAHGVPCEEVRSEAPGRVIYEDAEQIVVVPW